MKTLLALQEGVLLSAQRQGTASGVNPSCGSPFPASSLNILAQQVSLGLVLIQPHLLKCKLGHGGAGSFGCLYLQRKAGERDQSEQQSVAAVLQPARMQKEKHTHQFLNVSRDPLEIIYCICCRI